MTRAGGRGHSRPRGRRGAGRCARAAIAPAQTNQGVARAAAAAGLAALALFAPVGGASAFDLGADGAFRKRASSHFVLYQDVDIDRRSGFRGSDRFEREVLGVLESAYDALGERLGLRPPRPLEVFVYDPAVFDATYASRFGFAPAGFYGGDIRIRGDTGVTSQLASVLHHELVHAAFDAAAPSLVLPAWLNEGLAEWFEARAAGKRGLSAPERAELAAVARAGALPPLAVLSAPSFAGLAPRGARLAYLTSYAAIDHLAHAHGERDLRRFVGEVVRTRDVARSLRRVFRTDPAALSRDLAAGLR